MDNHDEIRISYLGGFSILLIESFIWLAAAISWNFFSVKIGILIVIIAGMFIYPLSMLFQKILRRPEINKENSLNQLFTQISLMIPLSFPLIFLVTRESENYFFPVLTIIIGIHFLPFIYAYKMKIYLIISLLLVIGGSLFGFLFLDKPYFCAYYTSLILFIFAFVNKFLVLKKLKPLL